MSDPRVRREIALRAAQLMYAREESEYFTAKRKAAKMLGGSARVRDLPSNAEIREQILVLAELFEGEARYRELESMRLEALRFLRLLARWRPGLIGSVLTGHVREGSDIDIHVFCDGPSLIADVLEQEGYACEVERKRVLKHHEERVFTHIHVRARYAVELTVYAADKANYPFKSSITGKRIERAGPAELQRVLLEANPGLDVEAALAAAVETIDRWALFETLLRPLEKVQQDPRFHPEGDALYHSLQVFELARRLREWDEEFVLAALLHDVGKGIDAGDHVRAGLEALDGLITERTAWLIEHHMETHEYRAGTLGARARRRLAACEWFEDLLLLNEVDVAGRQRGVVTPTVGEALEFLMGLKEAEE